jgi:hypothetical protein
MTLFFGADARNNARCCTAVSFQRGNDPSLVHQSTTTPHVMLTGGRHLTEWHSGRSAIAAYDIEKTMSC